jgi:hypothetical protein
MTRAAAIAWTIVAVTAVLAVAMVLLTEEARVVRPDQPPLAILVLLVVLGLADAVVGAAVAARQPRNPVGWLFLLSPFGWSLWTLTDAYLALGLPDVIFAPFVHQIGTALWSGTLPVAFILFPDGRLPSRRWWRIAWLTMLSAVVQAVPFAAFAAVHLEGLRLLIYLAGLAVAGVALVARFRSSRGIVRLQLAWVGYAGGVVVAAALARGLTPATGSQELADAGYYSFVAAIWLIPLAAGLAILRYRLYDIEVVIRRTLVYGLTTTVIATTFFGVIVVLQTPLRALTGGSEFAVAISTLASFALFQPLRARIQTAVDRRFYRARYDATRTIDDFSVRLRDEVDLDAVRADLLGAVSSTVQPAHAGIWLRGAR